MHIVWLLSNNMANGCPPGSDHAVVLQLNMSILLHKRVTLKGVKQMSQYRGVMYLILALGSWNMHSLVEASDH